MQRKQYFIKLSNKTDGNKFIEYLESKGYENIHKINYEKMKIKVLIVDDKKFFSTNVTCLAAMASCKINPISIDKFMKLNDKSLEKFNDLYHL